MPADLQTVHVKRDRYVQCVMVKGPIRDAGHIPKTADVLQANRGWLVARMNGMCYDHLHTRFPELFEVYFLRRKRLFTRVEPLSTTLVVQRTERLLCRAG